MRGTKSPPHPFQWTKQSAFKGDCLPYFCQKILFDRKRREPIHRLPPGGFFFDKGSDIQEANGGIPLQGQLALGLSALGDARNHRAAAVDGEMLRCVLEEGAAAGTNQAQLIGVEGVAQLRHHLLHRFTARGHLEFHLVVLQGGGRHDGGKAAGARLNRYLCHGD